MKSANEKPPFIFHFRRSTRNRPPPIDTNLDPTMTVNQSQITSFFNRGPACDSAAVQATEPNEVAEKKLIRRVSLPKRAYTKCVSLIFFLFHFYRRKRAGEYHANYGGKRANAGRKRKTPAPLPTDTPLDDLSLTPSTSDESSTEVSLAVTETPQSAESATAETNEATVVEEVTTPSEPPLESASTPLPDFKMTTFDDDVFEEVLIDADDLIEFDDETVDEDDNPDESPSGDGPDDDAPSKSQRYCGGLPNGSVIYEYVKSVREKLKDNSSNLSKQLAKGQYWICPPEPIYAVKNAKEITPNPFYIPRIFAFLPDRAHNIKITCDCGQTVSHIAHHSVLMFFLGNSKRTFR
jgi:hypothetical protein